MKASSRLFAQKLAHGLLGALNRDGQPEKRGKGDFTSFLLTKRIKREACCHAWIWCK
jgi:hypothetical protein